MGINFEEAKAIVELGIMGVISYTYITQQKLLGRCVIYSVWSNFRNIREFTVQGKQSLENKSNSG